MGKTETGAGVPGRRSARRVAAERLPASMREFELRFNSREHYRGETIDASLTGISFRVQVPANRIRDYLVELSSSDGKITMTQEIVYIKPIEEGYSRISLMFPEESTPRLYRQAIRRALRQG
jgi:hypothetical protein